MKFLIPIAFLLLVMPTISAAQCGYVHRDSVLKSVPSFSSHQQRIASMQVQYNKETKEIRSDLQAKLNALVGPYNPQKNEAFSSIKTRMKATDTLSLNILLSDDEALLKKKKLYSQMLQVEYDTNIRPIMNMVDDIVKQYAQSKKLEAVYIFENMNKALAYLDPKKVITSNIIKLVQKEYKSQNK